MKRIIAFSGAQGTGKSTLAKRLSSEFSDKIEICTEGAREAAKYLGISDVKSIKSSQRQNFQQCILNRHLDAIHEFKKSDKPVLICDRAVYDIYTYCLWSHNELSDTFLNHIHDICLNERYYTDIFYFPLIKLSAEQLNDGFRDPTNRVHIDAILLGIFHHVNVGYKQVPVVPTDMRMEYMSKFLGVG